MIADPQVDRALVRGGAHQAHLVVFYNRRRWSLIALGMGWSAGGVWKSSRRLLASAVQSRWQIPTPRIDDPVNCLAVFKSNLEGRRDPFRGLSGPAGAPNFFLDATSSLTGRCGVEGVRVVLLLVRRTLRLQGGMLLRADFRYERREGPGTRSNEPIAIASI